MDSQDLLWLGYSEEECLRLCAEKGLVCHFRRAEDPRRDPLAQGVWRAIRSEEKAGEIELLLGFFAPSAIGS